MEQISLIPQFDALGAAITHAGLSKEVFNADWRQHSRVEKCSIAAVQSFIEAHYLHSRPGVCVLVLRMLTLGWPIGCIVYALPPRELEKRYGGKTWELARLYIRDEAPRNAETWLIAKSVRYIKRHHKEVASLVSYADPSAGHSGTIYVAANWLHDGRTDEGRKTPRFDYADAVTGKKYSRRSHVPDGTEIKRIPRVSKNRFKLTLK